LNPSNLEPWLLGKIRNCRKRDEAFRRFAAGSRRRRLTRSEVDAYRDYRLRRTFEYAFTRSAFYREQFDKNGLKPEDFCGFADLVRFPFTEPRHLSESPYRFLCTSQADVARLYTFVTSGTTGPKKKVFWTRGDLDSIIDFMAAGIGTVASRDDVVHILLPDGRPYSQADLLHRGVLKHGAVPVQADMELDAEAQLDIIENSRATVVFGYAGHVFRITKDLESGHDLTSKGVKYLFLAAEYLPGTRRRELEAAWNCRVRTHYGLTEMGLGVAVECDAQDGYHFNEADLLVEIIDPETGERVAPGREGELVFTTLTREAMPLIRYRTHDIACMIETQCPCGAGSLQKFGPVRKRLESIVTLGNGVEMYPTLFDDLLFGIPDLIDYQVTLLRHAGMDLLRFRIEMQGKRAGAHERIRRSLLSAPAVAGNIASGSMSEPDIELFGRGALKASGRAKKLIVDRR
jgi:phenylacetate-CoA ligase